MSLGGFDGFAAPSNITPELENWFAQISAEMGKAAADQSIDELSDVTLTSATADDLLQYDGTNFVNTQTLTGDLTFSGALTVSGGVVAYPGMYAVNTTGGYFRHVAWSASSIVTSNLEYISGNVTAASSYQYIDAVGGSSTGGVVLNAFANGTSRGFYAMVAPDSLGVGATVATLDYIIAVDTNGIRSSSGSVTTPGFSFLNDTDTGMYLPSVGTLGFSAGNALRLSINTTAIIIGSAMTLSHNNTASRDKIRVWDSSLYAIGMGPSYTFGGLNDYAMTFQMDTSTNRGFWWGNSGDTDAQGAMALTQDGRLTVAGAARMGYGQSDTTSPATYGLDVSGQVQAVTDSNNFIMRTVSATSSPYISWYQTTTRQMYMQYVNGGLGRINVEGSSTYAFEIMTGGVIRFKIDGLDADEGRVYAENAQMYGGYLDQGTGTGAITIDLDRGNTHHLNNSGSRTVTLAGEVNGTTGILTIEAIASATSSWTWSTTIEWVGGTAPTLSTTLGVRDIIFLVYSDGVWHGSYTLGHA